ncbi:MAG: PAS domain-containing protein [Nitrospinaceae bacterium]|jgi:signal transduction histidine kinase|nr:PAS domain-containing protein [Nitrospinaceae bacterium]MBT5867789.1 PAS domain-containing protein [Nitrospinaceae bacterium]
MISSPAPAIQLDPLTLSKWQDAVNVLASTLKVPIASIARYAPPSLKIVCSNEGGNKILPRDSHQIYKNSFCEAVIQSGKAVKVVDSTKSERWKNNLLLKKGVISYFGLPLYAPSGKIFGTLFIMHSQANSFSDHSEKLLRQFKELFELHLSSTSQGIETKPSVQKTLSTEINNLPSIVYRCANDPDWTMKNIHGNCFNLTGYQSEDLENNRKLSYADLIHPNDQGSVWEGVQKGIERKEPFRLAYRIISASGKEKRVWEQGCGVYSKQGELQALEGIITEVTEQNHAPVDLDHKEAPVNDPTQDLKRLNQILKLSINDLKRSNQELETFAYVASHDLQEPLRKIKIFCSYIEKQPGKLDEKGKDYFSRILKASVRMQNFTDDLLQLSQLTNTAQSFPETDLNKIIASVLLDLSGSITQSGAKIQTDKMPTVPADATQMKQLFQNILTNSLKFQEPGATPVIKITSLRTGNKKLELNIEDNGIGVKPDKTEKIFEPLVRLHGRNQYEGTGLGLALCKRIISNHGWEIRAEKLPQQGTKIIITLEQS